MFNKEKKEMKKNKLGVFICYDKILVNPNSIDIYNNSVFKSFIRFINSYRFGISLRKYEKK